MVFPPMLDWTSQACINAGWPTVHRKSADGKTETASLHQHHLLQAIQIWLLFTLHPDLLPADGVLVNRVAKKGIKRWIALFKEKIGGLNQAKQEVLDAVGPSTDSGLALAALVIPKRHLTFVAIARTLWLYRPGSEKLNVAAPDRRHAS